MINYIFIKTSLLYLKIKMDNEIKIIGENRDIKQYRTHIDYEDSDIYLDPNTKENTVDLWVDENDEKEKKDDKNEKNIRFFTIKNTYEYPRETEVAPVIHKNENSGSKKKKDKQSKDTELTDEELARLEEVRKRRQQFQEQKKLKEEQEALQKQKKLEEEEANKNKKVFVVKNKRKKRK